MIDERQITTEVWTRRNKKHYIARGLKFTHYGDTFITEVSNLCHSSQARVDAVCDRCGKKVNLRYCAFLENVEKNGIYVCQSCSVQVRHDRRIKERQKYHYERLVAKSKENGYKLLTAQDEISNNNTRIRYECPLHGEYEMKLANYLTGRRCPGCGMDERRKKCQLTPDEVESRVADCGGVVLNASEYVNNSVYNLKFVCSECGNTFISSLQRFTQHGGQVCKKCTGTESLGEKKIRHYLENNNIRFNQEYWFKDCRDINPLPFDFYLPEAKTIIEFDGRQHTQETKMFTYPLNVVKRHDKIKNDYCDANGIELIRIPYTKINSIEKILNQKLLT